MSSFNRESKKNPKKGFGYCPYCDMWLLNDGIKCPECGIRFKNKRRKDGYLTKQELRNLVEKDTDDNE